MSFVFATRCCNQRGNGLSWTLGAWAPAHILQQYCKNAVGVFSGYQLVAHDMARSFRCVAVGSLADGQEEMGGRNGQWHEQSGAGHEDSEGVEKARKRLLRQWADGGVDLMNENPLWAAPEWEFSTSGLPKPGSVLLAHPAAYPAWGSESQAAGGNHPPQDQHSLSRPCASRRTGLRVVPLDAPRRERARLPVVLLTRRTSEGTEGLSLGVWSGSLLGDLNFSKFMTRPLYIGGPMHTDVEQPLEMLHAYPECPGSQRLTPDGLTLLNDWHKACDWIEEGPGSSMRFKFFLYRVRWLPEEERELTPGAGVWMAARCSRDLILREPDSAYEEPLWSQIADRAGGDLAMVAREHGLLPE